MTAEITSRTLGPHSWDTSLQQPPHEVTVTPDEHTENAENQAYQTCSGILPVLAFHLHGARGPFDVNLAVRRRSHEDADLERGRA